MAATAPVTHLRSATAPPRPGPRDSAPPQILGRHTPIPNPVPDSFDCDALPLGGAAPIARPAAYRISDAAGKGAGARAAQRAPASRPAPSARRHALRAGNSARPGFRDGCRKRINPKMIEQTPARVRGAIRRRDCRGSRRAAGRSPPRTAPVGSMLLNPARRSRSQTRPRVQGPAPAPMPCARGP
jgi:hypothetical protein